MNYDTLILVRRWLYYSGYEWKRIHHYFDTFLMSEINFDNIVLKADIKLTISDHISAKEKV